MSAAGGPGAGRPGPTDASDATDLYETAEGTAPGAEGTAEGTARGAEGTAEGTAPGAEGTAPGAEGTAPGAEVGQDGAGDDLVTVEDLVRDLERVTVERDQYLDVSRRIQADFENYKKAVAKREQDARERANESLVSQILPVLDACDGALASGASDVEPVRATLIDALVRQGLDRIDDAEAPFDPERHDAVMHEPGEGSGGPVVAEVLRAGYSWKGRVVRPAMVRVRG